MISKTRKVAVLLVSSQVPVWCACGAKPKEVLLHFVVGQCRQPKQTLLSFKDLLMASSISSLPVTSYPKFRRRGAHLEDCAGYPCDSWRWCLVGTPFLVRAGPFLVFSATGKFCTRLEIAVACKCRLVKDLCTCMGWHLLICSRRYSAP